MSKWRTTIKYKCECEHPYDCGKYNRFVLVHNVSIDMTTIFHKDHIEDAESIYELWQPSRYIGDNVIGALMKLLYLQPYRSAGRDDDEITEPIPDDYVKQHDTV